MAPSLAGPRHPLAEAVRTTDIEVAAGEIGHEFPKRAGVERDLVAGSDEFVEPAAAQCDELFELIAVDNLLGGRSPYDDGDRNPRREIFQESPKRGDTDARTDQGHTIKGPGVMGERPVGTLDSNPRARPQAGRPPGSGRRSP